jgi:F-type H+-transporting ATPase subunit delta
MALDKMTVGKKYGKALFEVTEEKGNTSAVFEDALALQNVFSTVDGLGDILSDNRLTTVQKKTILTELSEGTEQTTNNFLHVVFDGGRMNAMNEILGDFIGRVNQKNGKVRADVTTAVKLSTAQLEEIESGLKSRLKAQSVDLNEHVDESIIGGVILESDGMIIDGSVKNQLVKLRNLLAR